VQYEVRLACVSHIEYMEQFAGCRNACQPPFPIVVIPSDSWVGCTLVFLTCSSIFAAITLEDQGVML
jgi:hypothetical protein